MANTNERRKPPQLGDPYALFDVARQKRRKLTCAERIHVMTALRIGGEAFTQREMAGLFGVSQPQICEDMKVVDRQIADNHREAARHANSRVIAWDYQVDRIIHALWTQYEAEERPSQKAMILSEVSRTIHRHISQLQDRGIVPRAPHRVDANAVLVPLPELSAVARRILEAAAKTGLMQDQMETFRNELVKTLCAEAHAKPLLEGPNSK
jgi:predicted XRE-type DNA-binding protein